MRRVALIAAGSLALLVGLAAQSRNLEIYFIDTEGGQSTLLVSPSGETFMIDAGFAGLDTPNPDKEVGRDAARIAIVAKAAGITRIDTLLAAHFHGDHASGVTHLTEALPVGTFADHGPALQDVPTMRQKVGEYSEFWAAAFAKGRHVVVGPGDKIAVRGLDVTIVEALGKQINRAGTANPHCADIAKRADGNPEDTASVGVPSPAVYGMAPRIAVLDNGARKGGGADGNPPDEFTANFEDTDNTMHAAHYLKVSARDDGSFTVLNSRTGMTKAYGVRRTTTQTR